MIWRQVIDPFDNLIKSAFVAIVPVLFIFWALNMDVTKGSIYLVCLALIISIFSFAALVSAGRKKQINTEV